VPNFFNSGSSTAIAARMASAEAIMSGQKHLPFGELFADCMHSRHVTPVDAVERLNSGGHRALRQITSRVRRPVDNALPHGRKRIVWHEISSAMLSGGRDTRL
jgi:hypothetical protein